MTPEIETRVSAALDAWASKIDDQMGPTTALPELSPALAPHRMFLRWAVPLSAAAAVAAVVSTSVLLASHVAPVRTTPAPSPAATSQFSSPSPSPTLSHSPQPNSTTIGRPPPPDPRSFDFANATIDIPAWPSVGPSGAADCPSGNRRFINGRSTIGQWATVINPHIAYGNLDGVGGDEAVLSVACNDAEATPTLLFAVKLGSDGSLTTVGGAINVAQSRLLVILPESVRVEGSTVTVSVTGPYLGPGHPTEGSQQRGYQLHSNAFVQVSGPTTFVDAGIKVYADCRTPSFEPYSMTLACADNGLGLQDLLWTSWTPTSATAWATLYYNDNAPNHAAGKIHYLYNTHVTLSEPVLDRHGQLVWTKASLSQLPPGYHPGPLSLPSQPG